MNDTLGDDIKAAMDKVSNDVQPTQSQESNSTPENNIEVGSGEDGNASLSSSPSPEPEIEAPTHWASEDREVFKSLDSKGRDFLLRRHKQMEADHTKKLQAHAETLKIAERYQKVLAPHQDYVKQLGIDPDEAYSKLVGVEKILRTGTAAEKKDIFQKLATQYGVQFQHDDTQPEIDHKTQLIFQKLEQTEKSLLQLKQEREYEVQRGLQSHINEFTSRVDEKGLPKYPHFEILKVRMGKFLEDGEALSLEEAYEQAIMLNKDLREGYLSSQNKNIEAKKKSLASKDEIFNVKSRHTSNTSDPKKDLSLDQTIRQAINAQKTKRRI
jgi:hypothetical protein